MKKFSASLLQTLDSQKSYIDVVTSTNQFTQEAETSLKEAIASTKTGFVTYFLKSNKNLINIYIY